MPFTPLPRQLPQFTPSTIIGKNSGYNTQQDPNWGSGAVEPIMGFSDIVPDAVKSLTGSDLAATASSFFSPSSIIKRAPKANKLYEGQDIYRAVEFPREGFVDRRYVEPEYEFGAHVTVDPNTAREIVDAKGYKTSNFLSMKSNVGKPIWVTDNRWEVNFLVPRLINENRDILSEKTIRKLERAVDHYEIDREQGFISQQDGINSRYAKRVQQILKESGFDHISYINMQEGKPVESAILFNALDQTPSKLMR